MSKKLSYTIDDNGCWLWQLSLKKHGYGQVFRNGRNQYAHRYFYEQAFGKIPTGKELDHICRIRSCVNPKHLKIVTHWENMKRALYFRKPVKIVMGGFVDGNPYDTFRRIAIYG